VQRAPGLPCALFLQKWAKSTQTSGALSRENVQSRLLDAVNVREGGRSSIPETAVIEPTQFAILPRKEKMDCFVALLLAMTIQHRY
jgi:hypothetical protein